MKYEQCYCNGWKTYGPILFNQQAFASTHTFIDPFPAEGVFKYCPWCGKKRGIKSMSVHEEKYFIYLFNAREEGKFNMLEAPIHMCEIFGMSLVDAKNIFILWRDNLKELQELGF
ncbi:MAG: hypothetical protein KAS04_06035 [Candidatus Aenigmarchaeota archaeon]|nr:hypothetical protein [Candidatus Aenigmarchaeota archaeon]